MGEGREYDQISKRSKEILGQEVLPKADEGSACTAQGRSQSTGTGQDKRRSQVLQAQRTHRQRTQMYIKMLEKEVLRLRESEQEAIQKAQTLQQQLDQLVHERKQDGISSSAVSDKHSGDHFSYGHVTSVIEGDRGVYVNVEFPESYGMVSPATTSVSTVAHHPLTSEIDITGAAQIHPVVPEARSSSESQETALADPRHGIRFVLGLEADCMDHLRGKHLDHAHSNVNDSDFSGHVTTACLSLWQQHTSNLSTTATYDISSSELDRLLSSSLNLGLPPPEITPVQIWNRIRRLSLSGGPQALNNLTEELKEHVVCLGFGAVLDENIVEDILKRYYVHLPADNARV